MRKATEYLRAHPITAAAVGVALVVIVWLIATAPRSNQTRTQQPPPVPVASPAPGATPAAGPPVAPPAPAPVASPSPQPSPRVVAAAVDAGRPDPFAPLVAAASGERAITGAPAPPPAPLPPPLFPGQDPGQPGAQPTPPPPPKEASTAELVGLLGDAGDVAIIKIGGKTYIVGRGDVILNKIKVQVIDVGKRIVILEEAGEQFELKWEG